MNAIAHVTSYDFKEFDVIIGADNHILFGNCTIDYEKKQLRAGHSGWVQTYNSRMHYFTAPLAVYPTEKVYLPPRTEATIWAQLSPEDHQSQEIPQIFDELDRMKLNNYEVLGAN